MRKWLFRAMVYLLLGALAAGGVAYALGTNPAAVRQMVQQQFGERFRHVAVSIERARLRLLGGILVRELRLARNDGLDRRDFLYVPSAVIYHDKEHLLEGQVAIRKVELTRPALRLVRERDGRFNLADILGPVDLAERLPLIVIRQGTLVLEDRTAGDGVLLEIRDVQLTIVNDPLPTLQVEGHGKIDVLGPVNFKATVPRATLAADVHIDLPAIPVGPDLARRAASLCPELAHHAAGLTGLAKLQARLQVQPEGTQPLSWNVTIGFRNGRCIHSLLPFPLESIEAQAHCIDGRVTTATLTAAAGNTRLKVRLADLVIPPHTNPPPDIDEIVRELDVNVTNLPATRAVSERLPDYLRFIEEDFSPGGAISFGYRYRKAGPGPLVKEWTVEPQGMSGSFHEFPYPLRDVWGTIRLDTSVPGFRNITLDLHGKAGERPAALRGHIRGPRSTSEVVLDITGNGIPLDDRLYRALDERALKIARQFIPADSRRLGLAARPMGQADVVAAIRRPMGQSEYRKRFTITFRQVRVLYDHFPLPLENVGGVLDLIGDHWECRNFRGSHSGGEISVSGRSYRLAGPAGSPRTERIEMHIAGRNLLLDQEFEQALAGHDAERKGLHKAWQALRLAGRLSFVADVIDLPNQPQDIDVTVGVEGCFMRPTFFDYALEQVSASVRYARGRVHVRNLKARHGRAELGMASGLIQLASDGGFTAWLEGITGRQLLPDADLLRALPEGLRRGVEPLRLRDPIEVATKLTIVAPPGAAPLKVWWEGGASFRQLVFHTGVEVSGATGQYFCRGHHDGKQLRGVSGDLVLEQATVLGQPLTGLHARLEVLPETPDVIRIRDLKASLFGGTVGGEARLEVAPILRYDVVLEALGIQLDQFGRHNLPARARSAQLEGPARAAVHLSGEGGDLQGLKGNGRMDVVKGRMGQLPILLDLLKAFGLRMPDRTAFEQAHLIFGIEGPRLSVQQLDLYGNAISLRGQGTCDLDGSNLNLDFTATVGRLSQMLPAGIDAIPQAISQQLLKIKMRGKLGKGGEVRFDKELVPGVTEPLRWAFGDRGTR
jgi:hypothetical protein